MKLKILTTTLNKINKNFSLNDLELNNYAIFNKNTLSYYTFNHEFTGTHNLNTRIINIFNSSLTDSNIKDISLIKINALNIESLWIKYKDNIKSDDFIQLITFGNEKTYLNEDEFNNFLINRFLNT